VSFFGTSSKVKETSIAHKDRKENGSNPILSFVLAVLEQVELVLKKC
jgi:hypothetical protein